MLSIMHFLLHPNKFPVCDRVSGILIRMAGSQQKVIIFLEAHPGLIGITLCRELYQHPPE
jgi:hypothetical protein